MRGRCFLRNLVFHVIILWLSSRSVSTLGQRFLAGYGKILIQYLYCIRDMPRLSTNRVTAGRSDLVQLESMMQNSAALYIHPIRPVHAFQR